MITSPEFERLITSERFHGNASRLLLQVCVDLAQNYLKMIVENQQEVGGGEDSVGPRGGGKRTKVTEKSNHVYKPFNLTFSL